MPIHASKIGVFWQFDPISGKQYMNATPKRQTIAWKHVVWRI